MDLDRIASDLGALRHAALRRNRDFVDGPGTAAELEAQARAALAAGAEQRLYAPEGTIRAHLTWWPAGDGAMSITRVLVDHALDDPDAEAWLEATLDDVLPTLGDDVDLLLHAAYRPLLDAFLRNGVGISTVQLVGRVDETLERLPRRRLPPDVALRPLETAEDVEAVLAIRARVFSANPEFCWFGASEPSLARNRERLLRILPSDETTRVVTFHGQVLGCVSAELIRSAGWGPAGGMDLVLDPRMQGRGLASPAYRHLLDALLARRIPLLVGSTAQPAVLALARRTGRVPIGWNLRRTPTSPAHHFAPFV